MEGVVLQRFRVSDRVKGSVEVDAANWMTALGMGLTRMGVEARFDRIACEAHPGGTILVRDVDTGVAWSVLSLEDLSPATMELDLTEEVVVAEVQPATAADECDEVLRAGSHEAAIVRSMQAACALVPSHGASVLLVRDDGTLQFVAATGPGAEYLRNVSLPPHTGVVGFSVDNCATVALKDAYTDPRFFKQVDQVTGTRTRDLLCVPLVREGRAIGALELVNSEAGEGFDRSAMANACLVAEALVTRLGRPDAA
jgi:GAF domain-containing protein